MARWIIPMDLNWKFYRGECKEAWFKGYDDSSWKSVTLPHDWAVEEPFSREHSSGGGYLAGGIGWYRGWAQLPEECVGKHVRIEFDGVYNHARTWVNSYYFGKHPYGYTPFAYDISHTVPADGKVEVSVRVHHEHTADSRWFTGSGINRRVRLVVQEDCRFAQNGVFFTCLADEGEGIRVRLNACVEKDAKRDLTFAFALSDTNANILWQGEKPLTACTGKEDISFSDVVNGPRWTPETPNLLTLTAKLLEGGSVLDEETIKVGLRSIRFDPNEGFFLNGVNTLLKGICMHHDAGPLGSAVPVIVWERRLKKLKEMGCNAIRMSHNPQMTELYDLCDTMGFMVMDEAFDEWEGPKNKWWQGHNVYPPKLNGYFEDFHEWNEKDIQAMVERDRNHASIILWSIGNEIDYPNDPYCHPSFAEMTGNNDASKPAAERRYSPDKPNAERVPVIARHLQEVVKRFDDSRPVTAAIAYPELSNITGYCDVVDVCGYNYKEQWYDEDHAKYPNRVIYGSENGHGYHQWKAVIDKPFICGQFLWTGIDFFGETRLWPDHGSHAGLMTTAGYEKPGYYFRQSLWADKPVVKLATRLVREGASEWEKKSAESFTWNYSEGEKVEVVIYTNAKNVDLYLNDVHLGEYPYDEEKGYIVTTVKYIPGTLTAMIEGAEDSLLTVGPAVRMKANVEKVELPADGVSVAQIEVELLCRSGHLDPAADNRVYASVSNGLELLALDSGNLLDTTDCKAPYRDAFEGRLIVYIRAGLSKGEETLTLSCRGMKDLVIPVVLG